MSNTTTDRFVTEGPVRGRGETVHRSLYAAAMAQAEDSRACRASGGYSDRRVMHLLSDGTTANLTDDEYGEVQNYLAEI